jgi:hypothetical protein
MNYTWRCWRCPKNRKFHERLKGGHSWALTFIDATFDEEFIDNLSFFLLSSFSWITFGYFLDTTFLFFFINGYNFLFPKDRTFHLKLKIFGSLMPYPLWILLSFILLGFDNELCLDISTFSSFMFLWVFQIIVSW